MKFLLAVFLVLFLVSSSAFSEPSKHGGNANAGKNPEDEYFQAIHAWDTGKIDGARSDEVQSFLDSAKKGLTPEQISSAEKREAQWIRDDAERGHARSQNIIAIDYATGKGVEQNWTESYFWHNIVALSPGSRGLCFHPHDSDEAIKHLTPEQKVVVDKRVDEWIHKRWPKWNTTSPAPDPCPSFLAVLLSHLF